ncbi:MAG: Gfo/Idh/MocA family protein [Traorella sp.]
MNIVILGCGKIAHRIAKGIQFSKGVLYGIASRDMTKATQFAKEYQIEHVYDYDGCFQDPNVDLIYIATINLTHFDLIKSALNHHKHVICEKPMLSNSKEINEVFELAHQNQCFLMEAHKTCFTPLQKVLLERVSEIGKIKCIEASYCSYFEEERLQAWNVEKNMGGCFYDIGVYPLCFSNLYAQSKIDSFKIDVNRYKDYDCDFDCNCVINYENGIQSFIQSSWTKKKENKGIIVGEKGRIEVVNFWKNTQAKIIINGQEELIEVSQDSDFTGEINHAIDCIDQHLIESPIMSKNASLQISYVLEKMKEIRDSK